MSFQLSGFQQPGFQAGKVAAVAPGYSLAALGFDTPVLGQVVTAAAYSLAAPVFATPAVTLVTLLPVSSYSLGSPQFAPATLGQIHLLGTAEFALASLDWGAVNPIQHHTFFTNDMALGGPDFGIPVLVNNYVFSAVPVTLASPVFGTGTISIVGQALTALDYSLGSLHFARPRLQQQPGFVPLPPFYRDQLEEAAAYLNRILDDLMASVPNPWLPEAHALRRAIGRIRADQLRLIREQILGTPLREAFDIARDVGATFDGIDIIRLHLLQGPPPKSAMAQAVYQAGMLFSLIAVCQLVTKAQFRSQEDVSALMIRMQKAFELVKLDDTIDQTVYREVVSLGGKVTFHLGQIELQLPRHVALTMPYSLPALYVAQTIYADAARYEEIIGENRTINPAFMQRELNVLSK